MYLPDIPCEDVTKHIQKGAWPVGVHLWYSKDSLKVGIDARSRSKEKHMRIWEKKS